MADSASVPAVETGANSLSALLSQVELPGDMRRLVELELERINNQLAAKDRKISELRAQSITDQLTGLPNRRAYNEFMALAWSTSMRTQQPLAVISLDVDNFKKFNDTYGHDQGDICLKEVGDTLKQVVGRKSELACRLGGEEFVVVVPNATAKEASVLAERILKHLEAKGIVHEKNTEGKGVVTASIGVAHAIATPEQPPDQLYKAADKALYHAKSTGRNRVSVAQNARDKAAESISENIQKLWQELGKPDLIPWKPYQIKAEADPKTGQTTLVLLKETTQPLARFTADGKSQGLAAIGEDDLKTFGNEAIKARLQQASAQFKQQQTQAQKRQASPNLPKKSKKSTSGR